MNSKERAALIILGLIVADGAVHYAKKVSKKAKIYKSSKTKEEFILRIQLAEWAVHNHKAMDPDEFMEKYAELEKFIEIVASA